MQYKINYPTFFICNIYLYQILNKPVVITNKIVSCLKTL